MEWNCKLKVYTWNSYRSFNGVVSQDNILAVKPIELKKKNKIEKEKLKTPVLQSNCMYVIENVKIFHIESDN